jgi:hypothetical protein
VTTDTKQPGPLTAAYEQAEAQFLQALHAAGDFVTEQATLKEKAAGTLQPDERADLLRAVRRQQDKVGRVRQRLKTTFAAVRLAVGRAAPAWRSGTERQPDPPPGPRINGLLELLHTSVLQHLGDADG